MPGFQMGSIKTVEKKTHSANFPFRETIMQDLFGEVQIHFWLHDWIAGAS